MTTTTHQPHYLDPSLQRAHLAIFYRNFAAKNPTVSHIGLGVNALHTAKVLRKRRIRCDVFPAWTAEDVEQGLRQHPSVTHCLIEAPWVGTDQLAKMLHDFPHVQFLVRAHSQIGFLQVEPGAIKLMRDQVLLAEGQLNLTVSANTAKLCEFFRIAYGANLLYLPNLYDIERPHRKRDVHHGHRIVRIGSFGALRLLKNHTTAAAAAMMIARERGSDLELHMTVDRVEHGKSVLDAVRAMTAGVPGVRLVEAKWASWPEFRRQVSHMDLCLQPSMTETFNLVTADAVAEGVPCVVSPSIEWVPDSWKADCDEVEDMARIGSHLLSSHSGAEEGLRHLERYVREGVDTWERYLASCPLDPCNRH